MNQEAAHRNKCQNCYKAVGSFILDCYCFICDACFDRIRPAHGICKICGKPSSGKYIDTHDRKNMTKVNHLFGNFQNTFNKCMDIYRFQTDVDIRYCKYLENQLNKYKELINSIIRENPKLGKYVADFLKKKEHPHRSVSAHIQEREQRTNNSPYRSKSLLPPNSSQEYVMQVKKVKKGKDRNYSGNINYNVPNINYNTALRSSKRSEHRNDFDDSYRYYKR